MIENKTETYDFTSDIQKRIVAWLLAEKQALPENIQYIRPEYFDNPILASLTELLIEFLNKYSRSPSEDELIQEVDIFLEKNDKLPRDEYLDVLLEVLELTKNGDPSYIKDKAVEFRRHQAFKRAILEAAKKLAKSDYIGIVNSFNEVANIGNEDAGLRSLSDVEAKEVNWLWKNHIPLGEITLLIGDPGVGKSYLSYFLSAQVSKGGYWPDKPNRQIKDGKVLILSTDEDPNYAIRPRADAAGANTNNISILEGSRDEKGRIKILNLTRDIYRLENILKKDEDYRLVIIDPLSDYLGRIDSHKYTDVRWAMAPINALLARKYRVAIVGIMHCNKNTSLQVLYRIMGSMGFPSVARSIWLVAKDREDEENQRRYFSPLKNNLAPEQDTLAFHLENLGSVAKVVWEDKPVEKDFDIEDALVPPERTSETKRAKQFLIETLKDGAMLNTEVKRAARNEGISAGTLKRAKEKLNIRAFKESGVGGKWYWELPEFTKMTAMAKADAEARSQEGKPESVEEKKTEAKDDTKDKDASVRDKILKVRALRKETEE